jgi:MFS family permease
VPQQDSKLRKARLAAMSVLFVNGVIYASWGTHVPTIRDKFGLSASMLSLSMLAVALGGILIMAWAGRWIARVGSAHASVRSAVLMSAAAFGILLVPQYALLLFWLALYGAMSAINDVAANSQATVIEATFGRPVIGSLHGSFSLGGMVGALVSSGWQAMGWPDAWHLAVVCSLCALLALSTSRWLLPEPRAHAGANAGEGARGHVLDPKLKRHLVVLGALAFLALIVEGAMYDWTAVYMRDVAHAGGGFVSASYAAFSIGMACGRFSGDPVRAVPGRARDGAAAAAGRHGAGRLPDLRAGHGQHHPGDVRFRRTGRAGLRRLGLERAGGDHAPGLHRPADRAGHRRLHRPPCEPAHRAGRQFAGRDGDRAVGAAGVSLQSRGTGASGSRIVKRLP